MGNMIIEELDDKVRELRTERDALRAELEQVKASAKEIVRINTERFDELRLCKEQRDQARAEVAITEQLQRETMDQHDTEHAVWTGRWEAFRQQNAALHALVAELVEALEHETADLYPERRPAVIARAKQALEGK